MKKIFATGINGLLGTNLTNDLLEAGLDEHIEEYTDEDDAEDFDDSSIVEG